MVEVGKLVTAGYQGGPMLYTGIVTAIQQQEFLRRAAVSREDMAHVLCNGKIRYFSLQEDNIEVIENDQ
jgi:hypothetical protein